MLRIRIQLYFLLFFLLFGMGFSQVPSPEPHPGYDNVNILPPDWYTNDRHIGGMTWLDDSRMAVIEFHQYRNNGKVHIFDNVLTASSGAGVQTQEIADRMHEPLGIEAVNGDLYVIEKVKLSKLSLSGNTWNYTTEYDAHNPWEQREYGHWYSMGLVQLDNKLYWSLGGFTGYRSFVDELPERHGTVVEYDLQNKSHKFLAHGFRNTGGVAIGPGGTICTNDNQGEWEPACKMVCIEEGKWYGWDGPPALMRNGREETPPTIWNTHADLGRSPGELVLLHKGPYKGQMLMTDVAMARLSRIFLERVGGSLQGANFKHTGGFRSGTYRIVLAPDSLSIIVGGLGEYSYGGWGYPITPGSDSATQTSLHRLTPNGTDVFEMLAIRSLGSNEMEVEYTIPANNAAGNASNYNLESWQNIANNGYGGGHKSNRSNLNVTNVALSADGRKAVLTISGLEEGRVVRIDLNNNIKSQTGEDLLYTFGDYTLNKFGPADPVGVKPIALQPPDIDFALQSLSEGYQLNLKTPGIYKVQILDLQGRQVRGYTDLKPGMLNFPKLDRGIYFLNIENQKNKVTEKFSVY